MPTLATSEKRLISTLLENYKQNGVEGRPVLDTSRPLGVAVGFTPVQMLSYDEREQIISLVGWLNLQWRDALLQWNASEYDNVHQVVLQPRQIWTPDIVLINAISPPRPIHEAKLLALSTGHVVWASHVYYIASCPVGSPTTLTSSSYVDAAPVSAARSRTSAGPGDTDCELRFGSWTLDSDLLQFQPVTDRFQPPIRRHPDWDVVRARTRVYELQYPWRPGVRYPVVGFRLSLRRRRRQRVSPAQRRGPGSASTEDQLPVQWSDSDDLMPALRRLPGTSTCPRRSHVIVLFTTAISAIGLASYHCQ